MRIMGLGVPFRFGSRGYPEPAEDLDLLADSMEMILKTVPGERPHRPTFGSYLRWLLFTNMSQGSLYRAKAEARRAIEAWEPRVTVDDIRIRPVDSQIELTIIWRPLPSNSRRQQKKVLEF